MKVLAHISDLHFGRVDHKVLEPLRRRLHALKPDVVVVSGDLTQRARGKQFREARAYLETLPKPQLVVPGNHDVPLYNVLARFILPLRNFRKNISREVEPSYVDDEIAVLGVNTAHSFTFKGGRVSDSQLERLRDKIATLDGQLKVLAMHHHCQHLNEFGDVLLSGHVHDTSVEASRALVVKAGTATSSRTREEPNMFNLLRISKGRVLVEHYAMSGDEFERAEVQAYERRDGAWRKSAAAA